MKDIIKQLNDTEDEACNVCGMYEFEDAIVCEVKHNHIEYNKAIYF